MNQMYFMLRNSVIFTDDNLQPQTVKYNHTLEQNIYGRTHTKRVGAFDIALEFLALVQLNCLQAACYSVYHAMCLRIVVLRSCCCRYTSGTHWLQM